MDKIESLDSDMDLDVDKGTDMVTKVGGRGPSCLDFILDFILDSRVVQGLSNVLSLLSLTNPVFLQL